jgi:transaldolase
VWVDAPPRAVLAFSVAVKLFVDSTDPEEITACVGGKATSGVTTSASAVTAAAAQTGDEPHDLLRAICGAANGPVSVEVAAADRDGMLRAARGWSAVSAVVVVKLPFTDAGIEVVRACAAEQIRTGIGPCASPQQGLVAARAGATHVWAPVGRAGGVDGNDVIRKLVALFKTYRLSTTVVAGGIRLPTDVIDAALAGAHAAAAPAAVVRELDAESTRQADGRA